MRIDTRVYKGGEKMKIVFRGSDSRVVSYGSCGCACYPTIGAIGSNKPSLQVSH